MKTRWFLILAIAICVAAMAVAVGCGKSSSSSGSSHNSTPADDDSGGNSADTACQDFFKKCAPAGFADAAAYCSAYNNTALLGNCYVNAIVALFNCLDTNNCVDATCLTTYESAITACGGA